MAAKGPFGMLPLWQQLGVEVQAQAYSNVFMVTGCITLVRMALAFCLRSGRPSSYATADSEDMVAVEM